MSGAIDDSKIPFVWVGAAQETGICHLLVRDIAFGKLDRDVMKNLEGILREELSDDITVGFTEHWCCAVIQVPMRDGEIEKVKTFVEDDISMKGRILNVSDYNKMYETEIPAMLAAPGTITKRQR